MPMGGRSLQGKLLDERLCYSLWLSMSLVRVKRVLDAEGFRNPETGKPFSRQGIYIAAKRCPDHAEFRRRRREAEVPDETATEKELEIAQAYIDNNIDRLLEENKRAWIFDYCDTGTKELHPEVVSE